MMEDKKFFRVKIERLAQWEAVLELLANEERKISYRKEIVYPIAKWIYRGQGDVAWEFESSFVRESKRRWSSVISENALKIIESQMMEYFKRHVQSYVDIKKVSPIEILSMMQHYGAPTRLLDFTENPYIALFHAVYGRNEDNKDSDFVILAIREDWFLGMEIFDGDEDGEIERYFSELYNEDQEKEKSLQEGNHILSPVKYKGGKDIDDSSVLCIYPESRNRRLEAQAGLFLMPKKLSESFEAQLFDIAGVGCKKWQEKNVSEVLKDKVNDIAGIMFVFDKKLEMKAKHKLNVCNITHSKLFPDISGLAMEVKELYFNKVFEEGVHEGSASKLNLPLRLPELSFNAFMKDKSEKDFTKEELSVLKETLKA